ncbi:LLM class flavin-dependent oxidoreductase [Streptomyces sp. CA-132043]|uniref:LLM class flavin-dependent oxidoreductase n=1 Tax=Streptomyces sp. CA-132043 TaxID=3240048 RepID=UPI003D8DC9F1
MRIGLNILPTVAPGEVPADRFYAECLCLCEAADTLGLSHIKMVEHYWHAWGGYSPDPIAFLSAAAARTRHVRLVTGAVVPAFTHPVKLAAALSVLDNLSGGRLDAGFGRAFLPTEFAAFGIAMDESRQRLCEGVTAVQRLWTEKEFRWEGTFHRFGPLPALLPRPAQQPHPPVFIAATVSAETFVWAGERGHHLMIIPGVVGHDRLTTLLDLYREARAGAGHTIPARLHLSLHACLAGDRVLAREAAERHFADYQRKQLDAYATWRGIGSAAYPGYEKMEGRRPRHPARRHDRCGNRHRGGRGRCRGGAAPDRRALPRRRTQPAPAVRGRHPRGGDAFPAAARQ